MRLTVENRVLPWGNYQKLFRCEWDQFKAKNRVELAASGHGIECAGHRAHLEFAAGGFWSREPGVGCFIGGGLQKGLKRGNVLVAEAINIPDALT